jgi:hypothetical protein
VISTFLLHQSGRYDRLARVNWSLLKLYSFGSNRQQFSYADETFNAGHPEQWERTFCKGHNGTARHKGTVVASTGDQFGGSRFSVRLVGCERPDNVVFCLSSK